MRDVKHTSTPACDLLPYAFPSLVLIFFIVLIASLSILHFQVLYARAECIKAAADAGYTAEQTNTLCRTLNVL